MAENESSDTIAWDCLNGTDDVGTGKQPLGKEPNDNNHNNDIESEIDKVINDEVMKSLFLIILLQIIYLKDITDYH